MKLEIAHERKRWSVWRRLAAPGLVLIAAVLTLVGVVHLVQAQAGSSPAAYTSVMKSASQPASTTLKSSSRSRVRL